MSAEVCYRLNCYQYFLHEKTFIICKEFWNLSFEDIRAFILEVLKRLHNKPIIKKRKFIIIHEVDICKVARYSIVGILQSTYLDHKMNYKCGIKQ